MRTPLLVALSLMSGSEVRASVDFIQQVQPILVRSCYDCHGEQKQKSGFRLDVKQEAFHGGDGHAPNIVPGRSGESPLFRFISGAEPKMQMPPKGKAAPLSPQEIATIKAWIDEGALWPDDADQVKLIDKTDWWSFKPLVKPEVPKAQNSKAIVHNPIDAFIQAKLDEHGMSQAAEAAPLTLIRRFSFDLTGLPPTPEQLERFLAAAQQGSIQTINAAALGSLVDQLLSSPRYGERWARHWLDLVHYGETHGYDKDQPRNNAWPYRDYVVRAFNEDKAYARFAQEQLAGDLLFPGSVDGIVGLGFIAAGPWDKIGHAEVPESKIDGMVARHLDRDDMVQNTMGAFCSLTVGCAQCHNHKFDPISQQDYYSLQAVFAALDRTELKYYPDAALMARFTALEQQRKQTEADIVAMEAPLEIKAGKALAELDRKIEGAAETASLTNPNTNPDFGYHSAISDRQDDEKWVQVDLGISQHIASVVLKPCYDDFGKIGGGFGFPVRFKVETCDDPSFKTGVTLLWRQHDLTFMNDFRNPGLVPFETKSAGDDGVKGRYVRVTAVKLAPRRKDYIFALAEMQVLDAEGKNLALHRPVTALDSIEAPPRWRKSNLTDGIAPVQRSPENKAKLLQERANLVLGMADESMRSKLRQRREALKKIRDELRRLPAPSLVYAGGIHYGSGAFLGTGPKGGKPRTIRLLKRGDVKTPAEEVEAGSIQSITELSGVVYQAAGKQDGDRRVALAQWITHRDNPLFWRSIVNRVWQHHFGKPLVDTPNDFGRMGAQPSHAELLDWLAVTFRDDFGGSLKKLHRLIVMSHTYRQVSKIDMAAANLAQDAENRLLAHQNRRKLDAESIHDSVLYAAGKLDLTMGGPSYQDFVIDKPAHSPHYLYDEHDPDDPRAHRRSIYRFIVRSQQQPFMTCLDCADPSMRVDKRNESLSPLQALAMMNNGLMVTMAGHFAERLEREFPGDPSKQISRAYELALSRPPSSGEIADLVDYVAKHGLPNACRLILNLNEFTFVE